MTQARTEHGEWNGGITPQQHFLPPGSQGPSGPGRGNLPVGRVAESCCIIPARNCRSWILVVLLEEGIPGWGSQMTRPPHLGPGIGGGGDRSRMWDEIRPGSGGGRLIFGFPGACQSPEPRLLNSGTPTRQKLGSHAGRPASLSFPAYAKARLVRLIGTPYPQNAQEHTNPVRR